MKRVIALQSATLAILLVVGVGTASCVDGYPTNPQNGQINQSSSSTSVWDASKSEWVTPEQFWLSFAQRGKGKYWGRTSNYPPYADASEHDTILIELDQGVCLMEFFHRRWRRAQDVRRWDRGFNRYSGCPYVFDE